MDFFLKGHYGHTNGVQPENSSACEIVNERLMTCVQLVQKKTKLSSCLSCNFFQIIISCIMQPYSMYLKNRNILPNICIITKLSKPEYLFLY
jgi:hypothetical protein